MKKDKIYNIAIVGLGNIGSYLFNFLKKNQKTISNKNNSKFKLAYISARNRNKKRKIKFKKNQWINNYYEIIDWKTSKSIDKTSFGGKMGTHSITNHLMDCKFVHYSMQLSFYRYLLEKYYDLKIQNQLIAHLKGNSCSMYSANYYQKEVIKIINDFNNK